MYSSWSIITSIFWPKNISMNQNSLNCENNKFSKMFDKISVINTNINNLTNILDNNTQFGGKIINTFNGIKQVIIDNILNISDAIKNIINKIVITTNKIFKTIERLVIIFTNVMNIGVNIYYTIASLWNGPVGRSMQFFGGGVKR